MRLFLLLFLSLPTFAANVFVGSTEPIRTIDQVNAMNLSSVDSVFFRRGETFFGALNTRAQIGAYGVGAQPIITGFKSVSGWVYLGKSIYETIEPVSKLPSLRVVVINGSQRAMGRYPNGNDSWLYIDTVFGTTLPIRLKTASAAIPFNAAGAEMVIRKSHWMVDHGIIQSSTMVSVTYNALPGSTTRVAPKVGFGFFIQGHPATLDKGGEWYYNPSTGKLRVFMGTANFTCKVSIIDRPVTLHGSITGVTIEGSNEDLVFVADAGAQVRNCTMRYSGKNAIETNGPLNSQTITGNTIQYINNTAIYLSTSGGDFHIIKGNTVSDVGMISGTGDWGDYGLQGIQHAGSYAVIAENTFKRIGYTPIRFGNKIANIIRNNVIDSFCMIKDDGGGIYAYNGNGSTFVPSSNRVTGNIILNGVGNPYGTPEAAKNRFDAYGIYMDEFASGVLIDSNTISGMHFGFFNNGAFNIIFQGNTIRNTDAATCIWKNNSKYTIKGMQITGNIMVGKGTSPTAQFWETVGTNSIPAWGVSDYNVYVSASNSSIVGSAPYFGDWTQFGLAAWRLSAKYGNKDQHSTYTTTSAVHQFYWTGKDTKTVTLPVTRKDVYGNTYKDSVTIKPYSSLILY